MSFRRAATLQSRALFEKPPYSDAQHSDWASTNGAQQAHNQNMQQTATDLRELVKTPMRKHLQHLARTLWVDQQDTFPMYCFGTIQHARAVVELLNRPSAMAAVRTCTASESCSGAYAKKPTIKDLLGHLSILVSSAQRDPFVTSLFKSQPWARKVLEEPGLLYVLENPVVPSSAHNVEFIRKYLRKEHR